MKRLTLSILLICGLVLCGCGGDDSTEESSPTASSGTTPLDSPHESLNPLIEMPHVENLLNTKWVLTDVHDSSEEWVLNDSIQIELEFSITGNTNTVCGFSGWQSCRTDCGDSQPYRQ